MNAAEITDKHCIFRAVVGSTLHGLALESQDDCDEMGVCIEPPECVIGLRHFEQHIYRSKPDGMRSGPGDVDRVVYSLRKWCRLALGGNPTVLLLLFIPAEFVLVWSEWAGRLQALAPQFVARSVARPFLGYMTAQRQRLLGERGQKRIRRLELEEAHGFDTKYAMHMLRLGYQGIELLETGRLTLPMRAPERQYLRAVRRGESSLEAVLTKAGILQRRLHDLAETSPLRVEPDAEAVNCFLHDAYMRSWWKEWRS